MIQTKSRQLTGSIALQAEMAAFKASLATGMEEVKAKIRLITSHSLAGTPTGAVLDDAASASGKMLRPWLLLQCSSFGPLRKERKDRLALLAAMVELTHQASLIHDDIIDEAPYRRGKLSLQKQYGKHAAVYAGDFLMARIYYFEAKEGLNEAAMILSETVEHMCEGEIGQEMCRYREDVSQEEYLRNISGKTAALFRSACRIGASEAGCSEEVVEKLSEFGKTLGIMFQLRDDLIDFLSDSREEGKETHKDFRDGIYTMPVLKAMQEEECRRQLVPLMRKSMQEELTSSEIRQMEETVIRYGGVEATRSQISQMQEKCCRILDGLEQNRSVALMRRLVSYLSI